MKFHRPSLLVYSSICASAAVRGVAYGLESSMVPLKDRTLSSGSGPSAPGVAPLSSYRRNCVDRLTPRLVLILSILVSCMLEDCLMDEDARALDLEEGPIIKSVAVRRQNWAWMAAY